MGGDDAGALVRLPLTSSAWAETLPPAPAGHMVTVSFSSLAAHTEHAEAVVQLGYEVVVPDSLPDTDDGSAEAFMVVSGELARRRFAWWKEVRTQATAVHALAMGPVMYRFAPLLQAHLSAH